ncbi:MAG: hypothetical protein QOJ22_476 [Thermoleophilaceae bacterium]|jgi:hypothetical protein|nr:hypothetical protein [Thermoleophilaceae bacterium]
MGGEKPAFSVLNSDLAGWPMEFSQRLAESDSMQPLRVEPLKVDRPNDSDASASVTSLALQDRIEDLLDRHRGQPTSPSPREINDLYTDGCAAVLALETEKLRVKRRMTAAAIDSVADPKAAHDAAALAARGQALGVELDSLKKLVKELRTAVDWAQHEEADPPPRRRFRRL